MTTTTFFPDADPETTTVDGYVTENNNTIFATIRAAAGDTSLDTAATAIIKIDCLRDQTDQWDQFHRALFLFDTSAIGASSTIDSATFEIIMLSVRDELVAAESVTMTTCTPASNTGLVGADYAQVGTTKQASDKTLAGLTADDATYDVFTLNATGEGNITKDGITKFALRITGDNDNVDPGWISDKKAQVALRTADNAGTTTDPKLVVTFTPSGGFPTQVASSGVI